MSSACLLRAAARGSTGFLRAAGVARQPLMAARPLPAAAALPVVAPVASFTTSVARRNEHGEETFEEFTAR